jgi:hypothetical protein
LIKTLAERLGFLSGANDKLLVDGKGDVHMHSISGHGICVNSDSYDLIDDQPDRALSRDPERIGLQSAICGPPPMAWGSI